MHSVIFLLAMPVIGFIVITIARFGIKGVFRTKKVDIPGYCMCRCPDCVALDDIGYHRCEHSA